MKISVTFSLVITVISVTVSNAKVDIEEEFQKAFDSLDPGLHTAFEGLGGGPISDWLSSFKRIAKCIDDEIGTPDFCAFDTSYDPFNYLQKCAKGTLVQKVIEKFVKSIPTTGIMAGIPPKISKDRCFSLLPSIIPDPFKPI